MVDPEINALADICAAMEKVHSPQARERIFKYLLERYGGSLLIRQSESIDVTPNDEAAQSVPLLGDGQASARKKSKSRSGKSGKTLASNGQSEVPEQSSPLGTMNNILGKLKDKTGPGVTLAAAAQLTIGLGKEVFTRDELRQQIQSASHYYKETMTKNLTHSLKGLVQNGKLIERKADTYALSADTRNEMEKKLA